MPDLAAVNNALLVSQTGSVEDGRLLWEKDIE